MVTGDYEYDFCIGPCNWFGTTQFEWIFAVKHFIYIMLIFRTDQVTEPNLPANHSTNQPPNQPTKQPTDCQCKLNLQSTVVRRHESGIYIYTISKSVMIDQHIKPTADFISDTSCGWI